MKTIASPDETSSGQISRLDPTVVSFTSPDVGTLPSHRKAPRFDTTNHDETSMCRPHSTVSMSTTAPNGNDVVLGRGRGSYNLPGNKIFRSIVARYIEKYQASKTKWDKSMVINQIIEEVQQDGHARFLRFDFVQKRWLEVENAEVRQKVCHAIREAAIAADKQQYLVHEEIR